MDSFNISYQFNYTTILAIFLLSLGFFLYSCSYIIIYIKKITKCQHVFLTLISWCWILLLFFLVFIFDFIPYVKYTNKDKRPFMNNTNKIQNKILYLCLMPFSILLHMITSIGLLWWAAVIIYLVFTSYV